MGIQWKKTNFLGVRYREHSTRKHGGNRPDKCFYIHYKVDDKTKDEAVGWSSEGVTAEGAFKILSQLRDNNRLGTGPKTLAELRNANKEAAQAKRIEEERAKKQAVTFGQFWDTTYYPYLKATKSIGSIESETGMYQKWIAPVLSHIPMQELTISLIEEIIDATRSANRSAATLRYLLTVLSQLWAKAAQHEIVTGECPCKKIKKPREDNRRMRCLTKEEARLLLDDLAVHSIDMHDITLLSLYTGMRAGEIHALTWGNIDFENGTIEVVDTINKKNRHAFMGNKVKPMLQRRYDGQSQTELVFPGKQGKKRRWVGSSFDRAIKRLGLNNTGDIIHHPNGEVEAVQVTDRRKKVVFHTLRHTFASWLIQLGAPLYTVATLMGHTTIEMTQRYSHLPPDSLKIVAMRIDEIFPSPDDAAV